MTSFYHTLFTTIIKLLFHFLRSNIFIIGGQQNNIIKMVAKNQRKLKHKRKMLKQKWKKSLPTLPTPYDLMKKCTDMNVHMNDETKAIEEEKHRFIRLYGGF